MSVSFEKWAKDNIGKGIDYDGVYGVQCVDLAKHYIKNVLGINPQSIGNAIEYYNKRASSAYLKNNFVWIDNTPDFVPAEGDLCVFKSKSGNGHISVATGEGNTSHFWSYDQNYPSAKHEPMTKIKHSYSSFLGVLRPKKNIKSIYYKKYTGNSKSIVDAMDSMKIVSSYDNRKKIATVNGINNYIGSAAQNTKMLSLLKKGKLKKYKS